MAKIHPNQKQYHQQFPGGKTHLVGNRKSYLQSKLKTFYGPGQPPDSGGANETYQPPDDWPPKSYCSIRVPQVVWVTATFPQQFTPTLEQHTDGLTMEDWVCNDETVWYAEPPTRPGPLFGWNLGGNDTCVGFWNNDGQHSWVHERTDFSLGVIEHSSDTAPANKALWVDKWNVSTENEGYRLYNQFLGLLDSVKTIVESQRKGYTWVNHLIWFNDSVTNPNNYFVNTPFDNISYTAFTCPEEEEYFGLDFLHLHFGNVAEQVDFDIVPAFTAFTYGVAQRQLSFMRGVNQFRRFKIMLFDYQPDWTLYPPLSGVSDLARIPRPTVPAMKYAADNVGGGNAFKQANWVFAQADSDRPTILSNFITAFNAPSGPRGVANFNLTDPQNRNSSFITSAVADLSSQNIEIEYMGPCDSLSANDIVGIIQDHYQWPPAHS